MIQKIGQNKTCIIYLIIKFILNLLINIKHHIPLIIVLYEIKTGTFFIMFK